MVLGSAAFARARRAPAWTALGYAAVLCLFLGWLLVGAAFAQGSPSGEYGEVPLNGQVQGTLAPVAEGELVVYHTYTVEIPAGSGPVTIMLESAGADLDLAVNFGRPILDYEDVDHLDITEEASPIYTLTPTGAGLLYVDVMNLLQQPAGYTLTISASQGAAAPGSESNPLGGVGDQQVPAPEPILGSFEGDGLRVRVAGGEGTYSGELVLGGQSYAFEATGGPAGLSGTFSASGASYPFTASLSGDLLVVESGGGTYRTQRVGAAPAAPANPLGGAASPPAPAGNDAVLVQGSHATLTQDNANAFVEALEFSLQQAGFSGTFTQAERAQILQALAQNYPTLPPSDQAVLAQARDVWTRVQTNWAAATPADQREFVMGVFVLAFGPEAVQQAAQGGGGGAGSGIGCSNIDDCMSSYADPQTYQDTMNAQGCWAAAGCSDYDPVDNSFSYDSYDGY